MIRKILEVSSLILVCSTLVSAQHFGSADSHWVYNRDGARNGIVEVIFEKDTLIENVLFNKFDLRELSVSGGDTSIYSFLPLFLRNTDGVVEYSLDNQAIDTLINYNALPGDSWTIPDRFLDKNYVINVLDTFTDSFRGRDFRALSFIIHEENGFIGNFRDTIYEYFGFRHNYILPYDAADIPSGDNRGGVLLCFSNDELGTIEVGPEPSFIYGNIFDYDCNQSTSTDEIVSDLTDDRMILFPNPVSDRLHVDQVDVGSHYEIYSISGELLLLGELSFDRGVDVSALGDGIHVVKIGGQVSKFVKVGY